MLSLAWCAAVMLCAGAAALCTAPGRTLWAYAALRLRLWSAPTPCGGGGPSKPRRAMRPPPKILTKFSLPQE